MNKFSKDTQETIIADNENIKDNKTEGESMDDITKISNKTISAEENIT